METVENGHPRSEHLVIDSLDITEPIKSLVVFVHQKHPETHLKVYVDCLYQGEIPIKKTLKEMSEIEDEFPLKVVSIELKNYPIVKNIFSNNYSNKYIPFYYYSIKA